MRIAIEKPSPGMEKDDEQNADALGAIQKLQPSRHLAGWKYLSTGDPRVHGRGFQIITETCLSDSHGVKSWPNRSDSNIISDR